VNWTRIAAEAGYFDQMHLIKDFRELSGQTPTLLHQAVRATESWNPLRALDKE
jgi:AraC-like DNA-binding protein